MCDLLLLCRNFSRTFFFGGYVGALLTATRSFLGKCLVSWLRVRFINFFGIVCEGVFRFVVLCMML